MSWSYEARCALCSGCERPPEAWEAVAVQSAWNRCWMSTHIDSCLVLDHWSGSFDTGVEEIKGNKKNGQSSGSVGLQNVWEGLGLGLAQWAQENSMSMNFQELRI